MHLVSIKQLSILGKSAIALIGTVAALLQVPAISVLVIKLISAHPHIATITGAITTLAALMANPQVQKILGYTVQAETVQNGETTTTTQSTIVSKE